MAKIGFVTKPQFKPQQRQLAHFRNYGSYIQYKDKDEGVSVYIPKTWLKKTAGPYPNLIVVHVEVPDEADWS